MSRPSWAPAWMTEDTIRDVRNTPKQLYSYKSGMFGQQNFTGGLGPGASGYNPSSGAVLAGTAHNFSLGTPIHNWYDDVLADQAGYEGGKIPQAIPGTASNWTVDNPGPNVVKPPHAPIFGEGFGSVGAPPVSPLMPHYGSGTSVGGQPTAPAGPAAVVTPNRWFQNPWQTQAKKELPYLPAYNRG